MTRNLIHAYQIKTPLRRYDDHTGESTRIKIAEHIIAGQAVGLCSDAGTPIIADPGTGTAPLVKQRTLRYSDSLRLT